MKTLLWFALLAQGESPLPACTPWLAHPLPAEADAAPAKDCASDALLQAKDYPAARACAWSERAEEEPAFGPLGGASTLLALYANGWGVERDYDLARRMACEAGFADAEVENRLERLDAMASGQRTEPLDFCEDITSGYMMGHCAERDAVRARAERDAAWQALLADWPEAHREAFEALRNAAGLFFEYRVEGEVDTSGTGRGAFIIGEREALERHLLESVQAFERGEFPEATEAEYAAADREINQAYAAARAAAKSDEPGATYGPLGTIHPDAIRQTERKWIGYRDAWVAFGAVRWPAVPPVAWRTWMTRERTRQLRALYEAP